jgi:hypothetical protein
MMGILDWFKNRPAQSDTESISNEMLDWAVDKAVSLVNPRLKLLPNYHRRLQAPVETTIAFLRSQVALLPAVHSLSAKEWSSNPALRAFFVAPSEIPALLGGSENLRALFDTSPALETAYLILGMDFKEQRTFGMALHGEMLQRDTAQTSASFSDHRARLCGQDEIRLRRVVGIEIFEYLVAHALTEIGEERSERRELQENRALIRARLRLLKQHGPGLGSLFGAEPAAQSEQARLDAELLENERQLNAIGGNETLLEAEFECLQNILFTPHRFLHFEPQRLRLNAMNVVVDEHSNDRVSNVDFAIAELSGTPPMRRAFVLGRVSRSELPPPQKINFNDAARYL